jgi:hypothetical protein
MTLRFVSTFSRAVKKHGVFGTFARSSSWAAYQVTSWIRNRQRRREEMEFDRRHGVDTCSSSVLSHAPDVSSPNLQHGCGYQATPEKLFHQIMESLNLNYEEFDFVDLGSGKGKLLLLASEYPFRSIIGVEYCRNLHQISERNIGSYKSASQKCRNISSVLEDAAQFAFPGGPLVVFLYNPFDDHVMSGVLRSLEQSLEEKPRKAYLVYFNPVHEKTLTSSRLLARRPSSFSDCVIYEARIAVPEFASGGVVDRR